MNVAAMAGSGEKRVYGSLFVRGGLELITPATFRPHGENWSGFVHAGIRRITFGGAFGPRAALHSYRFAVNQH